MLLILPRVKLEEYKLARIYHLTDPSSFVIIINLQFLRCLKLTKTRLSIKGSERVL